MSPTSGSAQAIVLTFEGTYQGTPIALDSIHVINLMGGGDTTLYDPDHELVLDFATGFQDRLGDGSRISSMPNPFMGSTDITLASTGGRMHLSVHDATGRLTAALLVEAAPGLHRFRYYSGLPGLHVVRVEQNGAERSLRLMALEGTGGTDGVLSHLGITGALKGGGPAFTWQPGDELRCIGYASNDTVMFSGVFDETPVVSVTRTFAFFGPTCPQTPFVTDVDGHAYPVVRIGGQCWMGSNLRTAHYRDGSAIPNVTGNGAWVQLNTGAWSHYQNNVSYHTTHGRLYNWYAAMDPRGICPMGWHVPTDAEWQLLEGALGMPPNELSAPGVRGEVQQVGGRMKATSLWNPPNAGASNESGFSGLPSGARSGFSDGTFYNLGDRGYWWSATEDDMVNYARYRSLSFFNAGVGRYGYYKRSGYCIRCVQD